MRKLTTGLIGAMLVAVVVMPPGVASAATIGTDSRVTQQTYVRHDGGTDPTIEGCNSLVPTDTVGNLLQKNEPFSVVDPQDPDIVIAGWNDYCSDWMGLGFSTDGGATWTNSLVPGYPADTSTEGMQSPEFIRTNTASDPIGAFDNDGHFFFGFLAYNGFAGHKTNSDVAVARYSVVDPDANGGNPLDYLGTTRVATGPAASNFRGVFNDKNMIEVTALADRTTAASTCVGRSSLVLLRPPRSCSAVRQTVGRRSRTPSGSAERHLGRAATSRSRQTATCTWTGGTSPATRRIRPSASPRHVRATAARPSARS